MRSQFTNVVFIAALLPLTVGIRPVSAVDFESFEFSDSNGTELDFAANTANPGNQWTVDFNNLFPASVENGAYRITKDNDNFATGVLNIANVTNGVRYITMELGGWAFRGFEAGEPEELRIGFLDNDDGAFAGNVVTAQMQIARDNDTQAIELRGDAVGPGSTNLPREATLATDQSAPFQMVLELDKTSNTYEVFYKSGSSPAQSLGMGSVSPSRNGNSIRLAVNNNFGSDFSEFISINRIAVADANPITDLLTLEVNRVSGEMKLINTSGAALAGLESYSILSPSGALNSTNWRTIAGNYDSTGSGAVDVDNAWSVDVANVGELTESVNSGNGGNLAAGQQVVLSTGNGPWVKSPVENLFMQLNFAGGVTRSVNVNFVGNGGMRFEVADLNFDGVLTAADWTVFIANSETDLSGLSGPAGYQKGDLDGDGVNSVFDFSLFKIAYNEANGLGAFEAMLASIPEPNSLLLAAFGLTALAFRRRRFRADSADTLGSRRRALLTSAAVLGLVSVCSAAMLSREASAAVLEDFSFSDANGTTIDAVVNTANPNNMWLSQNTSVESAVFNGAFRIQKQSVTSQVGNTLDIANVTSGKAWLVAEISGWSYTAAPSSPAERVRFGFLDNDPPAAGSSTVAAEMTIDRIGNDIFLSGDALGTGASEIGADLPLTLTRTTPLTLVLELDKTLDQYSVYYKDGASPFAPLGTGNLGASTLNAGDRDGNSLRFAFTGTFGDAGEYFDVNRIYLTDVSPLNVSTDALTLRVNTTTGETWLVNESATDFDIDLYRIESPTGRLNAANSPFWNSLSDQNFGAIDGPDLGSVLGDGVGETWDESGGSDSHVLSEMFLLGSSTFAGNSAPVSIGRPFVPGDIPPLTFQYRNAQNGALLTGNVDFVSGGGDNADFDSDGDVDGADFLTWQRGFGSSGGLAQGDANGDSDVNAQDLAIWKQQFDPAPASTSTAAVPEPAAIMMVLTLVATVWKPRHYFPNARGCFN